MIGPNLTRADVEATTALAMDADAPAWLARRAGLTAYLQWVDGRTQTLVGLPD